MKIDSPNTVLEATIADTLGIVSARFLGFGGAELSYAVIRGREYNTDQRSFDFMPLCEGDVRHYSYKFLSKVPQVPSVSRSFSETIVCDTLLGAERYFQGVSSEWGIRWYRSSSDGLHVFDSAVRGEVIFVPARSNIGMLLSNGHIVVDTSTIFRWGLNRRMVSITTSMSMDYGTEEDWIEGLGLARWREADWFSGDIIIILEYAKLCNNKFGIPLVVETKSTPATLSVHPNPAFSTVMVSTTSVNPTAVRVTDLLGR